MKRIIVGISGASGVEMGYHFLKALGNFPDIETHLVITEGARKTWELECDIPLTQLMELAYAIHDNKNLAASVSSGSFVTSGMVVMPCSMKSLSGITTGYAANLLCRAADVCLKEGRKVVLVPREMPLGKIHLRNLSTAADLGCTIIPPLLTFYNKSNTLSQQINHINGKVLRQFGLESPDFIQWEGVQSC